MPRQRLLPGTGVMERHSQPDKTVQLLRMLHVHMPNKDSK